MPKLLTAVKQKEPGNPEPTQACPHHWAKLPEGDPASRGFSPLRSMQRRSGVRQGRGPSAPAAYPCGMSRDQPPQ
ncbi:hypothetical protein Anapl_12951, partial [Anas platyrhynchos]